MRWGRGAVVNDTFSAEDDCAWDASLCGAAAQEGHSHPAAARHDQARGCYAHEIVCLPADLKENAYTHLLQMVRYLEWLHWHTFL